jgi:hypothetical protein
MVNMKNASLVSALFYTAFSLIAAAAFFLATVTGAYTTVERLGGTLWVFLLSMIILMPVVTPIVKRKLGP